MNEGKICVSIRVESLESLGESVRKAQDVADIIELRLDYYPGDPLSVVQQLPPSKKPFLLTLRPREQGGAREISKEERLRFWNGLGQRREGILRDVEHDLDVDGADIVSYHNFERVPANLDSIYESLRSKSENAALKIACAVSQATDAIPLWRLLDRAQSDGVRIIPIAMGEAGEWTRILDLAHGASMTYASLDVDSATAAGQLSAGELTERYRVKEITRETRVYAVIGDPISHSLSPVIQNAAFKAIDEDAVFIRIPLSDLDEFMRRMVRKDTREVELNFGGFAVTMPHKRALAAYLDEIADVAGEIGSVNTVSINDEVLKGYNTDVRGFLEPLKERLGDLQGCRVAILGAGGAARSCVYGLDREGAAVTIFARDLGEAEKLAEQFGASGRQFASGSTDNSFKDFDLLVNATPIGMSGLEERIASTQQLSNLKLVYDLVTSGEDTGLIGEAKQAGVATIPGIEMLLAQGAAQFEIWTGVEAPRKAMADALAEL